MLLLVFRVAEAPYAVEAGRVVEVVPRVVLRTLPHAPEALAGLFRYRGRVVPVIDLGVLLGDGPSPPRLSTRIIVVDDHMPARGRARLGLIAEHVVDVRRVDDDRIVPQAPPLGRNPYLGPIASVDSGLIPLLAVDRLLAEPLRDALAGSESEASSATASSGSGSGARP
jgi:chemotaxis-related protein WspB